MPEPHQATVLQPSGSPPATASQPRRTPLPSTAPRPVHTQLQPRHQALGQPWPCPASKDGGARSTRKPASRTLLAQAATPANPTCARPPGTPAPTEACGGGVLRAGRGQVHGQCPPAQRGPGCPGVSLHTLRRRRRPPPHDPELGPSLLGRAQGLPQTPRATQPPAGQRPLQAGRASGGPAALQGQLHSCERGSQGCRRPSSSPACVQGPAAHAHSRGGHKARARLHTERRMHSCLMATFPHSGAAGRRGRRPQHRRRSREKTAGG